MIDYTGVKCPICGRPFLKNDDIVVCPECGAPYHRECYQKAGACVYQEKHGTGETWTPPKVDPPHHDSDEALTKKCPRCGNMNYKNALFCSRCGQSLTGNPENIHSGQQNPYSPYGGYPQNNQWSPPGGFPFGGYRGGDPNTPPNQGEPGFNPMGRGQVPFIFDPLGGVAPTEEIEGVPAGDLAKYVQNNTPYYLPVFRNQKFFRKKRFNFCAFLFAGGWMLYRKMYKLGTILTVIVLAINIAANILANNFFYPILDEYLNQISNTAVGSAMTIPNITFYDVLLQHSSSEIFLCLLPVLLGLVQLGIMFFCGIMGNKFYCDHCLRKVRELKDLHLNDAEYTAQLQEKGGVNMALAVCLLVCNMLMTYIPMFFV